MTTESFLWLKDALDIIKIDKPVLVLGKGPGLAKVSQDISKTHYIISINQALDVVEHANLVFSLDIHHILHIMFDPILKNKWDYFFIPDLIVNRWIDGIDISRLPFNEKSFEHIKLFNSPYDGLPRMRFKDVDDIVDFSKFRNKIIRFNRKDLYNNINSEIDFSNYKGTNSDGNTLLTACNSGHLAFHFLNRKGVKDIFIAGMGGEDGYFKFRFNIKNVENQPARWEVTKTVLKYLNVKYKRFEDMSDYRIKNIHLKKKTTSLIENPKIKILFYIEPLIEKEKPYWKECWVNDFSMGIIDVLKQSKHSQNFEYCLALNEPLKLKMKKTEDIETIVFTQQELVKPFNSCDYLDATVAWYNEEYSDNQMYYYIDLMRKKLPGFIPDIIITFSPAPFFRKAFPNALLLQQEYSLFSRPPYPRSWYFDPIGGFGKVFISKYWEQIKKEIKLSENQKSLVQNFKEKCQILINQKKPYKDILKPIKQKYDFLVLLPLQFSRHYGFEGVSKFKSQYELLVHVLDHVPENIGVVVTTHPEYNLLSRETAEFLRTKYPHFIYYEDFEKYYAPSQYIISDVNAVLTVSSSMGLQCLLWDKKVIPLGECHHAIADTFNIDELEDILRREKTDKDDILYWLLTRYVITEEYIHNPEWIANFLQKSLNKYREVGIKADFYDQIDNEEIIFEKLGQSLDKNIPYKATKPSYDRLNHVHNESLQVISTVFSDFVQLGTEYLSQKKIEEALDITSILSKCISTESGNTVIDSNIIEEFNSFFSQLIDVAENAIQNGQNDKAKLILKVLTSNDSMNIDALNDLVVIAIIENDFDEALSLIDDVFKIDRNNKVATENLNYIKSIPNSEKVKYKTKISQELESFDYNINIHNLPESHHIFTSTLVGPSLEELTGKNNFEIWWVDEINKLIKSLNRPVKIISLACGNGDLEIELLKQIEQKDRFVFVGTDINPNVLKRGEDLAAKSGLENIYFQEQDLNNFKLNEKFDVVIANHSLHHIVKLEDLFEEIIKNSTENMIFLINDMFGRNGHVMWDNTLQVVNAIWKKLKQKYKLNAYNKCYDEKPLNNDCSKCGFEGVRAEDILPLLIKYFDFEIFLPFSTFINRFVARVYGHNFNVDDPYDVELVKNILSLDVKLLDRKKLSPVQALVKVKNKGTVKEMKYRFQTPADVISARNYPISERDYSGDLDNFMNNI